MTRNAESEGNWDAMFNLQYDLCQDIDRLIDEACERYPQVWRAVAIHYVIEHLAERSRFDIELPSIEKSAP